ncbi:MAG: OprO/OprP family phosphate-selective porin [Myxococcota bacterium]
MFGKLAATWVCTVLVILACGAMAEAPRESVAHRILEILHADGTISDAQYRELIALADAEVQARLQPPAVSAGNAVEVGYKDGFYMKTRDDQFKLQIGGRFMMDWALFHEDSDVSQLLGEIGSGTEFRRARLFAKGQLMENVHFKFQYDFAGGDVDFNDVYLTFREVPVVGTVQVGHFKEPFGLEELTSSRFLTFMERSLPNVLVPGRNSGLGVHGGLAEDRITWAVGAFRETDSSGNGFGDDSTYNLTGRVTALPYRDASGDHLLHVGLSYSHLFRNNDLERFTAKPEAHLAPSFLDTGAFAADAIDLYNPELALVWGPFSAQAELTFADVNRDGVRDADLYGHYLMLSYFLTGESRAFKPAKAAFARLRPRRNFTRGKGRGAWEVAARYSMLKLSDAGLPGGDLRDVTVGVNWYLNPFVRIMFNYVNADLNDVGRTNVWQTRFQADF